MCASAQHLRYLGNKLSPPEPRHLVPADSPVAHRLLDQVSAFQYATVPNAPTYRAIMQVCYDAMQRYVIELRPDEILRELRAGGYVVDVHDVETLELQFLSRLKDWGNLAATADPAGVERLADFYRRRLVYHLTDVGEAAHRAVLEVEATVGRAGSLQTNMLVKIRDGLGALGQAASRDDPDELLRLLHDVHTAFETLTHEANRFMTDLGGLVGGDRGGDDDARFVAFKQAVLAYISRFVEQLRRLADEINTHLQSVLVADPDRLIARAAESADLPDFAGDGAARARWASDQQARWSGIVAWFTGGSADGEPTIERLASFAVGAVLTLTRTLGRLNDRRGRPVDRTTDFLTLARWFAGCDTDAAAHRLWRVAFGLHSARHVHLAEEDPERTSTRASWWDADPVEIPTRLRTHGNVPRQGRPPKGADFSQQRRWLSARARREREQLETAVARFAGRPLRLSDIASLDLDEFDLLLGLLDSALAAPLDNQGLRTTRTTDGRLQVKLRAPHDAQMCDLVTPGGRLRCTDYHLEVSDLSAAIGPFPSRSRIEEEMGA
jgi:uncharacterized protein (TIGR02677 family)